ncbi:MAG TPA: polyphosphate kinase 1 [Longimicrobiales bacterium]|nr:polyphosphate kinase 1 [Longimicrobiales bacterium]
MKPDRILRFEIHSRDVLDGMSRAPLPFALKEKSSDLRFYRVVYFDTSTGDLENRGTTVRLNIDDQGKQVLVVDVRDQEAGNGAMVRRRAQAEVTATDPSVLFSGISEPAQIIRALIDPRRLDASLELEIARRLRIAQAQDGAALEFSYDAITIRKGDLVGELFELEICLPDTESTNFEGLVQQLEERHQARLTLTETLGRARELLRRIETERLEENVKAAREVAVVPYDRGRIALCRMDNTLLRVPVGRGSGHDAVRRVLSEHFGRPYGRIRYLGTSPGTESHPSVEVWIAEDVANMTDKCVWTRLEDVLNMVGTPALRDARTLSALNAVARSSVVGRAALRSRVGQFDAEDDDADNATLFELTVSQHAAQRPQLGDLAAQDVPSELLINPELSRLLFDERILVMVEDKRMPLLERVKFLSMFWTRLDDFFMTRIAEFMDQVAEGEKELSFDGMTPIEQLEVTRLRARHVAERAYGDLIEDLLPALAEQGIQILTWKELSDDDRQYLRDAYTKRVETVITPVIADPTHPFPHIRNLRPAIAAIVRLPESTRDHFVAIQLPGELPRFVPLPGGKRVVPLEEIILAVLPNLYRGLEVVRAHTFRVTRSGNLEIAEEPAGGILSAVEAEIARRPFGAPVRLEVESTMPAPMRDRILRELQFEIPESPTALSEADLYPVERFVDLVALKEVAALPIPELHYKDIEQHVPFTDEPSIFEQLRAGDRLVCFPHDAFDKSVERLITEAADDPDVVSIKITLYRTDRGSRIVQALARAREEGKDAFALVELKASFDERRNVEWARSLESAGVHVVYSPANFKVHAKTALVVRHEQGEMQRYAYIGTGNLNAATARGYTDLGLFTTDPQLTEEVNGVFNVLTGYSAGAEFKHLLVSPFTMRTRFVELINREIEHVKAGRRGLVRIQMNGLADRRMIAALYRASQAGVRVEMAVREICCLRPGLPGISDKITVVSKLGRFLQHSRIFRFENNGEPEYFIGSADWRPRNLSKRVEVITPIRDPHHRAVLDELLDSYLNDPDAWHLRPDGSYVRGREVVGAAVRRPEVSAAD